MLIACYLASAVLFYYFVARSSPINDEPVPVRVAQATHGEVIEIFADAADRPASRAA